jgi:spore germination protein
MSIFYWLKKITRIATAAPQSKPAPSTDSSKEEPSGQPNADIHAQLHRLQQNLVDCADVIYHTFVAGPQLTCALVYLKGMVDQHTVQQNVLKTLQSFDPSHSVDKFISQIFDNKQLPIAKQTICLSLQDALRGILDSDTLLLVNGELRILALSIATFDKRSIDEASNEVVIRGPRESFIENLETNLTLLRRRLKTPDFKIQMMNIGQKTRTPVAITHLDGVCQPQLLEEVIFRLSQIDIDAILGTGYLEEFIQDNPYSPFPQLQYSERPDTACAALLEGRVVILADGTPISIIAPVTIVMLMQSAEDYEQNFIASSWIRLVRYLFLVVSLLLPSIYVAITTFHPDIIPEKLLITLAASREVVPFPALIEAFLMELSFEALREATIRIPKAMGQSVSIIGALIIGSAAVEAGIVSAAMVIIVSITGIASFITPHFDLGLAIRLLRFPIMLLAGLFGLFGIGCGIILIYLHLVDLKSFGVPYLSPLTPYKPHAVEDSLLRAPWWSMKFRPWFTNHPNNLRQIKNPRKWKQMRHDEE